MDLGQAGLRNGGRITSAKTKRVLRATSHLMASCTIASVDKVGGRFRNARDWRLPYSTDYTVQLYLRPSTRRKETDILSTKEVSVPSPS